MGWDPAQLGRKEFLILSTSGGLRADDGKPIALGYHTGHWEVGLLMRAAAEQFKSRGAIPFAGFCTDPCDGRTQGTPGMMDSLAYRNDAAIDLPPADSGRSPRRSGVMGVASVRQGLAGNDDGVGGVMRDLPCILVPGGVTLPPKRRRRCRKDPDAGGPLRPRDDSSGRSGGRWLKATPARRPAAVASFSEPRRRRKSSAKRWVFPFRTRRSRPPGSRSGSIWPHDPRAP